MAIETALPHLHVPDAGSADPAAATPVPRKELVIKPSRGWVPIHFRALWEYRELLYFLAQRSSLISQRSSLNSQRSSLMSIALRAGHLSLSRDHLSQRSSHLRWEPWARVRVP